MMTDGVSSDGYQQFVTDRTMGRKHDFEDTTGVRIAAKQPIEQRSLGLRRAYVTSPFHMHMNL